MLGSTLVRAGVQLISQRKSSESMKNFNAVVTIIFLLLERGNIEPDVIEIHAI